MGIVIMEPDSNERMPKISYLESTIFNLEDLGKALLEEAFEQEDEEIPLDPSSICPKRLITGECKCLVYEQRKTNGFKITSTICEYNKPDRDVTDCPNYHIAKRNQFLEEHEKELSNPDKFSD